MNVNWRLHNEHKEDIIYNRCCSSYISNYLYVYIRVSNNRRTISISYGKNRSFECKNRSIGGNDTMIQIGGMAKAGRIREIGLIAATEEFAENRAKERGWSVVK